MKQIRFLAAAALAASSIFGGTIVSDVFTGGTDGQTSGWVASTWTQTGSYSNVTIGADLARGTGVAYLLTQLGPGTTVANEVVAPFAVSDPGNPSINTLTTLFSGISLGPGTYFLLIDPAGGGIFYDIAGTPTRTLDAGVTQGSDRGLSGAVVAFSPASTNQVQANSLIFNVTGTPGAVAATPEPASVGMALSGLFGIGIVLRKRSPRSI